MARFFLSTADIAGRRGIIRGRELHHLHHVLRLRPGDRITVFDGSGHEHEAVIRSIDADGAAVELASTYQSERDSPLDLTLAVGLMKGDKMDFVVEKATELGVRAIVPLVSAYAVPRLEERKASARVARWQKIALSAAKQCGRARVPHLLPICEFTEFAGSFRSDALKLFFWEKEAARSLDELKQPVAGRPVLLAVGPEGGFSEEEAASASEHEFYLVTLGRRILRAETAAVVAVSLAQFLWGDLR